MAVCLHATYASDGRPSLLQLHNIKPRLNNTE